MTRCVRSRALSKCRIWFYSCGCVQISAECKYCVGCFRYFVYFPLFLSRSTVFRGLCNDQGEAFNLLTFVLI